MASWPPSARPTIGNTGVPTIGQAYQVTLANARAATLVAVTIGGSNAAWGSLSLPLDLGVIGMPGCRALASGELVLQNATDGNGNAALPVGVPNDPALQGLRLFHQWLVTDPGLNPLGLGASDAAEARIG